MSGFFCCTFLLVVLFLSDALVIPKSDGSSRRIPENSLSNEEHFDSDDYHNSDYDHEAFLGKQESKTFDELTPEESKYRLGKIVDKIDSDKDGYVSQEELKDWISHTQRKYIFDDTDRQWKSVNPNQKTEIPWETYKRNTYGFIDENEVGENYNYQEMINRDMKRWKRADRDSSGSLTYEEFMDFVHPEESNHMTDIVVEETMEDIDKNGDGKISIEEYIGDMYSETDADVETEPSWVESERSQFTDFRDKDKSGYMEFNEVKDWILPDDYENSEAEAKHLIYESDVNRDNQLSKEEILDKSDLFVGSQATDFGAALVEHDEF